MIEKQSNMKRGAAYCRFSSDMQREESINAQLRAINDYAEKNNILIVNEYVDRAKSATSDQRPEFQRMIKESADKDFDFIIVHKLDRFARNRYDSAHYRHQLKRNGVLIRSVVENLDGSPESIIMEAVLEGMAEYYSVNLSREVMKGLTENALKAQHTGGVPPFGYDVDRDTKKLVINEHEAKAVRIIFSKIIDGVGYGEILDELNMLGYKGKRGQVFGKNSIVSVVRNPKYVGDYYFNRSKSKDMDGKRSGYKDESEFIIVKDAIPAIISREDYAKVQEKQKSRMMTRKHSHAKEEYLLRGKMFCGVCDGAYVGTRRSRSKDGSLWVAYGCNKRYRSKLAGCNNKEISKPFIENFVLKKLSEYVFSDDCAKNITAEYNSYLKAQNNGSIETLKRLQGQLKEVNTDIDSIANLLIKTNSHTLIQKLEELESRKMQLECEVAKLQNGNKVNGVDISEIRAVFKKIAILLESGELKNIKQIIEMYVHRIEVFPDKAIVYLNFFPNLTIDYTKIPEKITEGCASTQPSGFIIQRQSKNADDFHGEGGILIKNQICSVNLNDQQICI